MSDQHLHFAWQLNPDGPSQLLSWQPEQPCPKVAGVLWLHLNSADPKIAPWLATSGLLTPTLIETLFDEDTRPRALHLGSGLLLTLRVTHPSFLSQPDDMASIRLWIDEKYIISTSQYPLQAVTEVHSRLKEDLGPKSSGEFLSMLLDFLVSDIGEVVENLQEQMADVEESILDRKEDDDSRQALNALRRQSIALRRYLGPQREALLRLIQEKISWITTEDHFRLRETTDELIRYVEDVDTVREQAALAHEEIVNQFSETLNSRMLTLAVVSAIFLPLGFLTGLFGINVGGIPGANSSWGFAFFCLVLCGVIGLIFFIFKRNRWF